MNLKKGQTTLFIFIGILILFSVFAIMFLKTGQVKVEKIPDITETIPTDLAPVKIFVEDCVKQTAIDAVTLIGAHGGYIGLEPDDFVYTQSVFKTEPAPFNPTEYDALTASRDWKIPYWWHLKSPNTCTDCKFTSERPPLKRSEGANSIENQIDRYININLNKCLKGFSSFSARGMEITNNSGVKTTTTIADKDISVFVEYPLRVRWAGGESSVSQFKTSIDVNLKEIYNLATDIINVNNEGTLLELNTMNFISAFSGTDENKLPPPAGTELRMTSRVWSRSKVKEMLSDILSEYINAIQVERTANYDITGRFNPDDPVETGLYSSMVIPLQNNYYFDLEANMNYMNTWPMYLYITKGETIRARESIAIPLVSALIPFQRYDFPYDISYPVLAHIRQKQALKGNGYDFFFALEVNIRNNAALNISGAGITRVSDSGSRIPLCNENSKDSGDVTIRVADALGNPVPAAQILFSVGDVTCLIGETSLDGDVASFTGKFPMGAIGSLMVKNADYEAYSKKFFNPKSDPQDLGIINLKGYVMKNVSADVISVNKDAIFDNEIVFYGWQMNPAKLSLGAREHVLVILERIKSSPDEDDVTAAADIDSTHPRQMRLLPGKYKATISLIKDNATVIIPKEEICSDSGGLGSLLGKDECEDIGPTKIIENGPFMTQYEMDVEFTDDIYDQTKNIVFTGLDFNLPDASGKVHDDIPAWQNSQSYVNQAPDLFAPTIE